MSEKKMNAMNVMDGFTDVEIYNPIEGVYTAVAPVAGMVWIETGNGAVIIDTLASEYFSAKVFPKIKEKIKYIIYTHGHADHVGGAKAFIKDNPEVIAHRYLPDRFDRYKFQAPYRSLISEMQWNLKLKGVGIENYIYPTKTIIDDYTFTLGNYTFELHTGRGETDDVVWVYIPEIKTACIGDLIIGKLFPNIGNPWKPTRYALDWVKELKKIQKLEPEIIICNGGSQIFKEDRATKALDQNIEVIQSLHDQVVKYINEDMHITEIIHAVKIPKHLDKSPYLKKLYSRPEFFVFNLYRFYHGYYDHNPAHLLPRPEKEVMKELFGLIGDPEKILKRANDLQAQKQTQLALQVLDVLIQAEPENIDALKLRQQLCKTLGDKDYCLMSRNAYYYAIKQDKKKIRRIQRNDK